MIEETQQNKQCPIKKVSFSKIVDEIGRRPPSVMTVSDPKTAILTKSIRTPQRRNSGHLTINPDN